MPAKKGKSKPSQTVNPPDYTHLLELIAAEIQDGFEKLCSILENPPVEDEPITGPIKPLTEQPTPQPPAPEEVKP